MNDAASQINQILNNPEMLQQIKAISGLLNKSSDSADANNSPGDTAALSNLKQPSPLDLLGTDGLKTAMKFMPILSELKKDDETTQLLYAIKPFLSPQRQAKLDEAIRLLRIIKILPLLKNQGLMNLM